MRELRNQILGGTGLALVLVGGLLAASGPAAAADKKIVVGVSWSNFQEERWKTDEAAIKAALTKAGASYIGADAQSSPTKQLSDVESLIARGATALIILAQDTSAIQPAIDKAKAEGIPVVGYDRLIESPGVFYLTFDNREVGRIQARAIEKAAPKGNYVLIKGSSSDPNADFLHAGNIDVLKPAIDSGAIKVVGEEYTPGWLPENAQREMEQILTKANNKVDAVIAANDGTAGGAVAALQAQGLAGIPVSGQDGDKAALNRIARGLQTVSVWKDARLLGTTAAEAAVAMAKGTTPDKLPNVKKFNEGPKKVAMDAVFLTPVGITKDNLDVVIKAGWVTKEVVCQGVDPAKAPAACK
ncbi:MAG TPA: D-xylose ABC transporter substrate-binding protein [Aliidongia sp.]|uniref:D-xylose ABC transporter substrate-binding protein n=1 Tax=Aliidongia sp. TaxID=1914230 RepID=UPI002DDD902F|nr:D-xylose ABC transporter substrate-binding protein [Aliidongia sp.]HEV2677269.1 D-xylose ABC transporter substrate-binding protein [Aliidongia sp.]